nr:DUF6221 family protein [Streptomyces caniscabiei]
MWATEASRRYGEQAPEGGVHWCWEATGNDEEIQPDPSKEEWVGQVAESAVSLRSRETWPTHSVGELPQFAIPAVDEVPSAVGGHIVRHDPARVLREIDAKRRIIAEHTVTEPYAFEGETGTITYCPICLSDGKCPTLRLLALPFADREGYREEWAP